MRKLMLLTVAVFAVGIAKAQFNLSDVIYGVKGGWNITNISNADANNKMSVHLGAFAEWRINDYFGISPEILYSRQGYRDKGDGYKTKNRINYLNIPVLAKLYVLEGISVDLGPQFGFALNARHKAKGHGQTVKTKIKDFNTFDLSFALGASCILDDFVLSARYNIGLTNVFDHWNANNKNHVFQLSVGYCLNTLF